MMAGRGCRFGDDVCRRVESAKEGEREKAVKELYFIYDFPTNLLLYTIQYTPYNIAIRWVDCNSECTWWYHKKGMTY